jgi:hypothetical protein
VFIHGGFDNDSPNIPKSTIGEVDILSLLMNNEILGKKIEKFIGARDKKRNDPSPLQDTPMSP